MKEYQSLAHTRWDCKYHVVFIPKRRKKTIFGVVRKHLGMMLHDLAQQKECKIVEGHLMPDHVHMCISIPPKHSVNFTGENFWARGYFVSTVGLDEEMVRAYI